MNYIPRGGRFKIDGVEVLGSRQRSTTVYQLLIELVCNPGDVILDLSDGCGASVFAANNAGNHILVNESRKLLHNNLLYIASQLVNEPSKATTSKTKEAFKALTFPTA